MANSLAKLGLLALSRLGGYLPGEQTTPENPTIRKSLAGMLTPYIARKLAVVNPTEVHQHHSSHITFLLGITRETEMTEEKVHPE